MEALLVEKLAIQFLPIAVDRSPADQKWASEAAKQETLKAALDELETRLDDKKTLFVAMTEFFNIKPPKTISQESLSFFFFEALEAGKAVIASVLNHSTFEFQDFSERPPGN